MSADRLKDYYARRSAHYERIYTLPERQEDLARLRALVPPLFAGRDLLEIACGTGYWTALIAPLARSILATDVGDEVLALARSKEYPPGRVRFATADAFALDRIAAPAPGPAREGPEAASGPGAAQADRPLRAGRGAGEVPGGFGVPAPGLRFDGAFAGFWWSHIPKSRIGTFLDGLHARIEPGARVVFIDNRFVAGSSTPLVRTDDQGNSVQHRRLEDGSEHDVVKNFPSAAELRAAVSGKAHEVEITELTYYWCLSYLAGAA